MNQTPENETDAIRSDIDSTRRRMDDTIDAIGDRLKGRHLFDELLGFFRSDNTSSKAVEIRDKVTESASTAARSVAETLKANPVPALLIGAGIAWIIYSSRKSESPRGYVEDDGASGPHDSDVSYDDPLDYPSPDDVRGFGETDEREVSERAGREFADQGDAGSKLHQVKVGLQEKASEATQQVEQKLSSVGNQVRQKTQMAAERARRMGSRVQARTRDVYVQTRERVVTTADQHPLEVGLACLAAGVAAGITLPTSDRLNQVAGPTMDRLRQRTRDASGKLIQKGKSVVNAATTAMKNEAQQQGLTFDSLRQKAGQVAERTKDAAGEAAQQERGLPGSTSEQRPTAGQDAGFGQEKKSEDSTINVGRGT